MYSDRIYEIKEQISIINKKIKRRTIQEEIIPKGWITRRNELTKELKEFQGR